MRKRWIIRIALLILILGGFIPLFLAIIPARRQLRSIDLPHQIRLSHGSVDLPALSTRLDEPVYYRAGVVENIRLTFDCMSCSDSSDDSGKPLSLLVRLQVPFAALDPNGQVIVNGLPAARATVVWDATTSNKEPVEGTLWVFAALDGENSALLAIPIKITSLFIFGQPLDLAALLGCLFSFIVLLSWLFMESRKKARVSGKPPENIPVL